MPVARNTPLERRRVKTGCLACRQRRRKCDEKQPQCTNCESRRVTCKYAGTNLQSGTYAQITFIENKPSPKKGAPVKEAFALRPAAESGTTSQQPASRPTIPRNTVLSSWESYFDADSLETSQRELALFRQFIYRTAPWLEAGDPNGKFGTAMSQTAQDDETVRTLILELASSQLWSHPNQAFLQKCRPNSSNEAPELKMVTNALICLVENLCAGPFVWKRFRFHYHDSEFDISDTQEPLRTLIQQQSYLDLAASILTLTPPATHSNFYLSQCTSMADEDRKLPQVFTWALYHLTTCLQFVCRPNAASAGVVANDSGSHGSVDWHSLWLHSQAWFDSRPVEMRSLVDVGSIERNQMDLVNRTSFPIHLYSSAIAVQSAIIHHITIILLLQHKPRLLSMPGRRQHLTSPNWHAGAIAGIATSNDFPEQWNPIVIASLITIARKMTHSTQQQTMLECLQNISIQTGISLEQVAKELRAHWAVASLVEGSLSH